MSNTNEIDIAIIISKIKLGASRMVSLESCDLLGHVVVAVRSHLVFLIVIEIRMVAVWPLLGGCQ
jgi:hypothetical protein